MARKKTKIERVKEVATLTKIVKMTYLQSLAIYQGEASTKDFVTETEGSSEVVGGGVRFTRDLLNKSEKFFRDNPGAAILPIGTLGGAMAGIGSALFGKKKKVTITSTIKDSGWRIDRTWRQPEFDKVRYAIGVKEVDAAYFTYAESSEMISKPWVSPKAVSKVSLVVDEFIPDKFPAGQLYTEYYVKPENEDTGWIRVNPLGTRTVYTDNNKIIPRIVNFNIEKPISSRLEETFVVTKEPVKQLRLRVVLKRPETVEDGTTAAAYTPILKSYRMLMTVQGGL